MTMDTLSALRHIKELDIKENKATFYKWDAKMKAVIEMPNLPADGDSIIKYIKRGFHLRREDAIPKETQAQVEQTEAQEEVAPLYVSDNPKTKLKK